MTVQCQCEDGMESEEQSHQIESTISIYQNYISMNGIKKVIGPIPIKLTSIDDLVNHMRVAMSFFQLCRSNPDLSICRDIFTSFVEDLTSILVCFQARQGQPELHKVQHILHGSKCLHMFMMGNMGRLCYVLLLVLSPLFVSHSCNCLLYIYFFLPRDFVLLKLKLSTTVNCP